MELYSVKRDFTGINNFKDLFCELKGDIKKLLVVSAYYDQTSIKQLITMMEKQGSQHVKKELVIILDRGASNLEELKELDGEIQQGKNFTSKSGIFVAQFTGGIFHSKGYLAETNKNGELVIGSMNLTQKGISGNEELVIDALYKVGSNERASHLAQRFEDYVSYLVTEKSELVRETSTSIKKEAKDIRSFFLDGHLYYESKEQTPFRFNLNLPKEILKTESPINRILDSETSNSIDISTLIENASAGLGLSLPIKKSGKSLWKRFCIHTCYGYWCPNDYEELINNELNKKDSDYYLKLYKLVLANSDMLFTVLCKIIDDLSGFIEEQNVEECWKYSNKDTLSRDWDKWLTNLEQKFKIPSYAEKLSSGISSASTPDVWAEKQSASDDFEESAFSSVLYELGKAGSKNSRNEPAYAFFANLSINSDYRTEDIRKLLDRYLKNNNEQFF